MRTPDAPHDPVAEAATIRLPRPLSDDSDLSPLDVRSTPLPAKLDGEFPHVRGYEILSVVGTGGMAIVYEARHKELNRRVAIKMLRGAALADPGYRERFRAEAAAIARLQHPNIIQVFEIGTVEPTAGDPYPAPFLALEFVDGGSLTPHASTPHPPRAAAKTVETIARAAHAAHRLGIVHRDLKPANVLLTRDGTLKVADFGIAKRIDDSSAAHRSLTREGAIVGTPEYMAPEQFHGDAASPAIDVYALGVILYELLTARVPFQGASFADTMFLAMRQEPVPPRRLQPGVPRDLETICLKCLEKLPAKRYGSAEELADDLARWADGRAIRARAVGAVERTARWARRNPAVAMLSVAVLLVALTGVSGVLWNWNEAKRNAAEAQAFAWRADQAAGEARGAANKERWERYRVSVFAASSALRLSDTVATRRALDDAPPEHRDWVWQLLHSQLDKAQHVLPVGGTDIRAVQFSANGRRAIVQSGHGEIRAWDLVARTEHVVADRAVRAESRIISDDGTTVAYAVGGSIVVYDLTTGRTRVTLRGHTGPVDPIAFGPDGRQLHSSGADGTARVWDLATGATVALLRAEGALSLLICPEGRTVAVRMPDDVLSLWDLATGRSIANLSRLGAPLLGMRFSPRGDRFAVYDAFPSNTIRVWDVATGRQTAVLRGHENQVSHMQFSPDGTRLVTAAMDRTVRVWDAAPEGPVERGPLLTMEGHTGWVNHAAFSPDGSRIVSSSTDRTLRLWDARTGKALGVLHGHTMDVLASVYRDDGAVIASGAPDGTLRLWDARALERGATIRGHEKFVYSVAFHPNGNRVASAAWDGTARVWSLATGDELLKLHHPNPRIVSSVAFSPDGHTLATLARDGARLWDANTGRLLHHWYLDSADYHDGRLTFSPDGNLLAAGAPDALVHLWDVNTKVEVAALKGHKTQIRDVVFAPDGTWLASAGEAGDPAIRVWNPETKKLITELAGHTETVYALGVNRTGTRLASGELNGTVRLWDTATWREVGPPMKTGANVYAVAFTHDGKSLAAGCADNLIRIFDLATHQELAALREHSDYVHSIAFSPDGSRLISGSGDTTIRVWDTLPPQARAGR